MTDIECFSLARQNIKQKTLKIMHIISGRRVNPDIYIYVTLD